MGSVQPSIFIFLLLTAKAIPFIPPALESEQESRRLISLLGNEANGSSKKTSEKETFVDDITSEFLDVYGKPFPFVDKSMLIDYYIQSIVPLERPLAVTAPARWGKTVNAEMLRAFFQVPRDDNGVILTDKKRCRRYQVFEKLDIGTKTDLLKEEFGSREVLKMDFMILNKFSDYHSFERDLCLVVKGAIFRHHQSHLRHFVETDPKVRLLYQECDYKRMSTIHDASFCVLNLIEVLYHRSGCRLLMVIIDEISAPFQHILRLNKIEDEELNRITNAIGAFLADIIKWNHLVWRSFLTGIMQFGETYSEHANNLRYRSIFRDDKLLKFYGFTTPDVDYVTKKLNDIQKYMVMELFDGYQSYNPDSEAGRMFCPGGVEEFVEKDEYELSEKQKQALFLGSHLQTFSKLLSPDKHGKTVMDSLMSNNPITFQVTEKLVFKDLLLLKKAEDFEQSMSGTDERLFFYMMENGLFTGTKVGNAYHMHCPNKIARSVLEDVILREEFYLSKLKITPAETERFRKCVKELEGSYDSVKKLTNSIKALKLDENKSIIRDEREMTSMFHAFLRQSHLFDVNAEYFVQNPAKNDSFHETAISPRDKMKGKKSNERKRAEPIYGLRMDVFAIRQNDKVAIIFENKFHTARQKKKTPPPDEALVCLLERNYHKIFEKMRIKKFILVGVVLTDEKLSCSVLADSLDLNDKITYSIDRHQPEAPKPK